MNIFSIPWTYEMAVKLAKNETIWYVDYNDTIWDRKYSEIKDYIYNDDSYDYDFYDDEMQVARDILKDLISAYPEIQEELDETEDDENKDIALWDLRDVVMENAKYNDIQYDVIKNSGDAWMKIEMPYYRDAFSELIWSGRNNDKTIPEQYVEIIKYWAKKMWIKDYLQFAKKSVNDIQSYLNLEYSPLYYDYPLAFYTKIELTDYLEIARNPWKVFTLKLHKHTWFWITDDGWACERIDRDDITIDVIQFEGDRYFTVCDGSEKIERLPNWNHWNKIQGAYLSDFYWDQLCGLTHDAHWTLTI